MSARSKQFRFKQFSMSNSIAGMKVGTDGVLIGAWAYAGNDNCCILDIGTGTGLIALMMAQRNSTALITGVEIDPEAYSEAVTNVSNSPWHNRITILNEDISDFKQFHAGKYDIIVSNPPYFINSLKCPDARRSLARHTDSLPPGTLFACVAAMLKSEGSFSFIFPTDDFDSMQLAMMAHGMTPVEICHVHTTADSPAKRIMCRCIHCPESGAIIPAEHKLIIETAPLTFTPEYIALTRDFYLAM